MRQDAFIICTHLLLLLFSCFRFHKYLVEAVSRLSVVLVGQVQGTDVVDLLGGLSLGYEVVRNGDSDLLVAGLEYGIY